ncbi:MAG: glycoside hydrolase family 9 protein [Acetatifactor sp.]|nr:glycoside hydrolase family 9 protein [Acetatifactor sp.]
MYKNVFVNQCGYLPGMQKKVTIRSEKPTPFSVHKSSGEFVLGGTADKRVENASAGETDYIGDFSALTEPGRYYIMTENRSESDTFVISENAYDHVLQKSFAFFYLQRCGCDLPKEAAGAYAHRACHTGSALVYGTEEHREVSGGWHDAGDYGRYVGPGAMAVAQLLYAYERNPSLCGSYLSPASSAPEAAADSPTADTARHRDADSQKRALPAWLEELKYELDWMKKMQREDGALYHKASCRSFCGFIMPEEEQEEIVLSPVSVTATGDFAAVLAMAVRFYEKYLPAYAAELADASKKAYQAMKVMELPGGFKNPPEISTGEYGDACDRDERYWAAAELYKTFGDAEYREDFEKLAAEKIYCGYGWADMGTYGNLAYLSTEHPVDEALKSAIQKEMVSHADTLLKVVSADGYGVSLTEKEYVWGSNMNLANNGLHLFDAWKLTDDRKYLDAAAEQLHYLLGRNPMGLCYVTGCGSDAIRHPHHRPSGFQGKAMPGMLSGGPCSWLADETVKGVFTAPIPPAKCLCDMTGSYSTNEVTVYWNSAFLQLLASVTEALH